MVSGTNESMNFMVSGTIESRDKKDSLVSGLFCYNN